MKWDSIRRIQVSRPLHPSRERRLVFMTADEQTAIKLLRAANTHALKPQTRKHKRSSASFDHYFQLRKYLPAHRVFLLKVDSNVRRMANVKKRGVLNVEVNGRRVHVPQYACY